MDQMRDEILIILRERDDVGVEELAAVFGRLADLFGAPAPTEVQVLETDDEGPTVLMVALETDDRGEFSFTGLEQGTYLLQLRAHGFAPEVRTGVTVRAEPYEVILRPLAAIAAASPSRPRPAPAATP